MKNEYSQNKLIAAMEYASWHHRFQRRKGFNRIPYINHPVKVAKILCEYSDNLSDELIIAALLHDVVEDTDGTIDEIRQKFGEKVAQIVYEVTDNMSLPQAKRKELQIEKSAFLSTEAQQLKIADKICNIYDIIHYPLQWSRTRKREYIIWSQKVVDKCRGHNLALETYFDEIAKEGLLKF